MALQFDSLKDFTDHLDYNAKPFPLKIMGEKRPDVHYTATMLSAVYQDTPDADSDSQPWNACFGIIRRRGAVLNAADTFSAQILASGDGSNLFQGDIIKLTMDLEAVGPLQRALSHGIIVSHSCDIGSSPFVTVCPAIFESEADASLMSFLKGKVVANPKAEFQNLLRNEQHRFLGLPSHGKKVQFDEPIVVPLSLMIAIPKNKIGTDSAFLRLTYRANAYFQMRLATLFMRDVQRSDETRDF